MSDLIFKMLDNNMYVRYFDRIFQREDCERTYPFSVIYLMIVYPEATVAYIERTATKDAKPVLVYDELNTSIGALITHTDPKQYLRIIDTIAEHFLSRLDNYNWDEPVYIEYDEIHWVTTLSEIRKRYKKVEFECIPYYDALEVTK